MLMARDDGILLALPGGFIDPDILEDFNAGDSSMFGTNSDFIVPLAGARGAPLSAATALVVIDMDLTGIPHLALATTADLPGFAFDAQ